MSIRPIKSSQYSPKPLRSLYGIFGWKMPAVTLVGLVFLVMAGLIPLLGRPSSWLTWTAVATFATVLVVIGAASLRERWLSLAPLAGFRVRPYRSSPLLKWLISIAFLSVGSVLMIGGLTQPPLKEKDRTMILLMGGCCLFGALGYVGISLTPRRHVLVREGLALRHRHGWNLVPWDRIDKLSVASYYENMIATVQLSHLLTPLPAAWRTEMSAERRQRLLERQLAGFQQARNWTGADLLIWKWSCGKPPGLLFLKAEEALADPAARERLPTFEEVTGMSLSPSGNPFSNS